MDFLKNMFSSTDNIALSESSGIIAIDNANGGFDVYGALYRHTLQEIIVYMNTRSKNPLLDVIKKNFRAPFKYVTAYYHAELHNITYVFSYPISAKLLNDPTYAISTEGLFKNDDIVTITAIYEINQIKLQNSHLIVDGSPDISLLPENSSEYVPHEKEFKWIVSPERFYIDSGNIKNTLIHKIEFSKAVEEGIAKRESLLADISSMTGVEFEQYCRKLLIANGFSNVRMTKTSHDYGGDILAEKDQIKYVIQCKRYSSSIGIDAVQQAIGSRSMYSCHVAAVMTNSEFTDSARILAFKNNIILWDGMTIKSYQKNLDLLS